ncbi:MAG: FtsW/RodA/SpoVE family cell cycle protein [Anaerolineae bacterium]
MSARRQRQPIRFDAMLLLFTLVLLAIGLVMVYSSSYGYAYEGDDSGPGDSLAYAKRQLMYAAVGLVGLIVAASTDYRRLGRRPLLQIIAVLTGIALFVMMLSEGRYFAIGGRDAQTRIGQPSEFAKLGVLVYMAAWLASPGRDVRDLGLGFLPFLLLAAVPVLITLADPDFSTALILGVTLASMYFVAGAGTRETIMLSVGGFLLLLVAGLVTEEFRMGRLLAWIRGEPSQQLRDVLLAFGRGGLFGVGLGNSTMKVRLYAAHTDCILAIIGEEFGFAGSLAVMLIYGLWVWRGLRIASQCPDPFGAFLAQGLTVWVAVQAIVNVGALTETLPFTGTVLPFISGGGSSLMTLLVGTGILLSISGHDRARPAERLP